MKKFLVLIVLLPLAALSQALSGNYIIGASQAAPFNTLTNAINRINIVGVSGPVVFLLDNANYNVASGETFPIAINQFAGSSASNTFTIKPNAGKTVTIKSEGSNSWTYTDAVIKLNSADNVTINGSNNGSASKDLTLQNTNPQNYLKKAVIWLATANGSGANNNSFSNLILKQTQITGAISAGIFAGGTEMADYSYADTPHSHNTINNISFTNVGQGIYLNGSSASASVSWSVANSTFGSATDSSKPFVGIYVNNVRSYTISNNTIDGVLKTTTDYNPTHGAIYVAGASSDGIIFNNKISNIKETTGSAGSFGIYATGNNTSIYNNFINDVRANGNGGLSNNGYGIYLNSGQNVNVYHNTVRLATNQASGFSAALFVNDGSALDIRNNIFVNLQTSGATIYAVYSAVAATAFAKIDYNDYYSKQYVGYIGSNRTTLPNWKTGTGKDAVSANIAPVFTSSSDLHIIAESNGTLDNLGTPIATVLTDIDSETRSTVKPDLGADEFDAPKCASSTTWNGTVWSNGAPSSAVKAILNGNYNTNTANITACELVVNAGFTLTINAEQFVEVINNITVSGNLVIEDRGTLVQSDDAASDLGTITLKRKTTAMKQYDYTYWSSPVKNYTLNQLSPNTLSDKYMSWNTTTNGWSVIASGSQVMEAGKGYIIRAPQGWNQTNATQGVYEGSFTGVPNSGVVPVTIQKGPGTFNLIGNPYPSAIDIDAFLLDPANANVVNGTIYMWTHNTAVSNYTYTRNDYAKYNITGGVRTASAASGSITPSGKIASGQGFFIEAKTSLANGTYTANFKNSMRVKAAGSNSQFFRAAANNNPKDANAHTNTETAFEKNRVWLSLSNTEGAYDEMLLGYITGATNEMDNLYDGKTFPAGNVVSLYSILNQTNLAIQGRALPFDKKNEVIALGFSTTVAGAFTISLSQFDGFFENQNVYLLDKLANTTQELKASAYTFTTATGTFNDRFEIRFTAPVKQLAPLATEVTATAKGKSVAIKSSDIMQYVTLYDLSGRTLFENLKVNAADFTVNDLDITSNIVIVKITTANNQEIIKKLMVN